MKILYLITKSEAGGAQTHLADLCRYFKAGGHKILVMSGGAGWLKDECEKIGVDYRLNKYFSNSPNPFRIFKAIREIKKCVIDFKPDIAHCHSSAAAFLGRWAIKGEVKTVYTAHGWGFNIGMNPLVRLGVLFAEKITARYTDIYICVAEFVKKLGLKYRLAPEEKFLTIYNGVEVRPDVRRSSAREINLSFVGRLAEPKRPELAIEAVALLPSELKQKIRFTIIGDGPKRGSIARLAADRGVAVDLKGDLPRPRVFEELNKSNVFVFISAWEGLPYTILEAMAVGLPVVASAVGGVAEMVSVKNGVLIKTNRPGEIAEAIKGLLDNTALLDKMSAEARDIVRNKFSLSVMLAQVDAVYKKLLHL